MQTQEERLKADQLAGENIATWNDFGRLSTNKWMTKISIEQDKYLNGRVCSQQQGNSKTIKCITPTALCQGLEKPFRLSKGACLHSRGGCIQGLHDGKPRDSFSKTIKLQYFIEVCSCPYKTSQRGLELYITVPFIL